MFGLVLCGGHSTRMGSDKGSLIYGSGKTQRLRCVELLEPHCERVFVSCREDQRFLIEPGLSVIVDSVSGDGPGVGILSAHKMYADESWFVLACDFPFADNNDVASLVNARDSQLSATCYANEGALEPLFAIWEHSALDVLRDDFQKFNQSPRRVLASLNSNCKKVTSLRAESLRNVNSPC
jgi:molybdopterin-guanine dinucleotide biosynthesis protein A